MSVCELLKNYPTLKETTQVKILSTLQIIIMIYTSVFELCLQVFYLMQLYPFCLYLACFIINISIKIYNIISQISSMYKQKLNKNN